MQHPDPTNRARPVADWLPRSVISGGQTGVDRAALDWAMGAGIAHGGACPVGRLADDGVIPARYQLVELPGAGYRQRTRHNVRDSEATLILNTGPLDGGSLQTLRFAQQAKRACLVVQLDEAGAAAAAANWLLTLRPDRLNVAGPREAKRPGIGMLALATLQEVLRAAKDSGADSAADAA